jgi:hypothetical protein
MISQVTAVPRSAVRLPTVLTARALASYDLLLCGLLGMIGAARLWLVPGYFRADSWLALVAGREVSSAGIPHHESLTAIAAGARWTDQQWLAHVVTYDLYRVGGLSLIAVLAVALTAGAFAAMVIAARALHARARTVLVLMPVTLFPFFAQSWQPRTQTLAYPLFAAVFLLLLYDSRRPSNRVLLVLPILVLWGNLHGSAVLGATLIALRGCLLLWERRGRRIAVPISMILLTPVALLITPYGTATAGYYRATLLDPSFKQLAGEWQPITHDPVLIVPFACLTALTAWTLVRGRRETTLWERLALVVLVVAAASALRNVVWLSLGALPVLAVALNRVIPADPPATTAANSLNRVLATLAAIALAIALLATVARPEADFERSYPSGYLQAVRHAAALDPAARIVADVGDADWLLWRDPALRGRIAFDARLELLSTAHVRDIASLLGGAASSRLRGSVYRIFALDRRAAAATVAQLAAQRGRRILYRDAHRVVFLIPRVAT